MKKPAEFQKAVFDILAGCDRHPRGVDNLTECGMFLKDFGGKLQAIQIVLCASAGMSEDNLRQFNRFVEAKGLTDFHLARPLMDGKEIC